MADEILSEEEKLDEWPIEWWNHAVFVPGGTSFTMTTAEWDLFTERWKDLNVPIVE